MYSLVRSIIARFDRFLRHKLGIFEFWDHPDCLIRVSVSRADRDLPLADGVVDAGQKIVEIHFWNEHIPDQGTARSEMAWAARSAMMLKISFNKLAEDLVSNDRFSGVVAIGGVTPLVFSGNHGSGEKIWRRLGFAMTPYTAASGRFGEFWENLYTWLIMWTFNPVSVKNQRLLAMRRAEFWTDTETFLRIHHKISRKTTPERG